MSEEVLRSYLSRSMTTMYLLTGHGDFDDNLRMLKNCGVKFAGRAVYQWGREEGGESALPAKLEVARKNAARIHAMDPEMILQACVFEIVSRDVEKLPVPAWAFEALGKPVETRNFSYERMCYPSGRGRDQWGAGASIPDVSQLETKLWFFYLAASYLEVGCEAVHFGQAEIMNGNDPGLDHWAEVLGLVRARAAEHARRHFVMCDAHVPHGGLVREGKLLLDFHSFPLRIEEVADKPREGRLRVDYKDSIYGRSKGGITPSGWRCGSLPYLVEFDNYGRSKKPGEVGMGVHWVWGWDEITWFSQQPEDYRNGWLRYAQRWVREQDGHLQMPGARCISGAADGKRWYDVNRASAAMPNGSGQEDTIREIWMADE
ncbi:MAG: hypothetical protein EOP88_16340 [Verrucomicrobiaceae bacterium]|nr:MAG: hypothetical protein EOP88_16340 [Verrucomicrobiaceae bacterium]